MTWLIREAQPLLTGYAESASLLAAKSSGAKSPLRYPGGKSRAVKTILQYIPLNLDQICAPFFGGGSVEIALALRGISVRGYDIFWPLVNFWQRLLKDPVSLRAQFDKHSLYPLTAQNFYALQQDYDSIEDKDQAAAVFYALNRASFSGTTLSGGMSHGHERYTERGISALKDFRVKGLSVHCADFKKALAKNADLFLYCDPPYMNGEKLYGERGNAHKGFDHKGLADILNARDGWILSYNDCKNVRELYGNHHILTPQWAYGMGRGKKSNELLILSKDLRV